MHRYNKDGIAVISKRMRPWLWSIGGLLTVVLFLFGGVSWYISDLIRENILVPTHAPGEWNLEVTALDANQIRLQALDPDDTPARWRYEGLYGVESTRGYAPVGSIIEQGADYVVREFHGPLQGQVTVGDTVRMDSYAFAGDPQNARDLPFEHRTYTSAGGAFPAWYVDGPASRWIIFVHGQNATREEALRTLPLWTELGYPALVITYATMRMFPATRTGIYGLA